MTGWFATGSEVTTETSEDIRGIYRNSRAAGEIPSLFLPFMYGLINMKTIDALVIINSHV